MKERREEQLKAFGRLLDIMDELREKCPWDRKQTNESLRANTIEETYELCEAITNNDEINIKKELGDLLLHIVFYAKIGSEKGSFDIADVCDALCDKLIFRHPHVFGEAVANSAGQVEKSWEEIKLKQFWVEFQMPYPLWLRHTEYKIKLAMLDSTGRIVKMFGIKCMRRCKNLKPKLSVAMQTK